MNTLDAYRQAAPDPRKQNTCRLLGCDEPSAAQVVIRLRERQRHLAGKSATFCEEHAIALYEQFAREIEEGPRA